MTRNWIIWVHLEIGGGNGSVKFHVT